MAASSNSHTLGDLLLETHKALGVLAPSTRCLCSISNADAPVTWVGSVRTTLAGHRAGWILVRRKKHKMYCPIRYFWLSCYRPILTRSLLPAYPTGCFKRFGSHEGKAALGGDWTPDISVAAVPTRIITIYLVKGLFPFSPPRWDWYHKPGSETETAADHLFSSAKQISALASAGNGLQRAQHTLAQTLSLAAVMHSFMSASSVPAYSA